MSVAVGDEVHIGQPLLVMEAMKMEHVIESTMSGIARAVSVAVGDTVFEGHPLVVVEADGKDRDVAVAGRSRGSRRHPSRPGRGPRSGKR